MADGPFSKWLKTYTPTRLSTAEVHRFCAVEDVTTGRTYCGRRKSKIVTDPSLVTCADCIAAARS